MLVTLVPHQVHLLRLSAAVLVSEYGRERWLLRRMLLVALVHEVLLLVLVLLLLLHTLLVLA